MALLSSCDNEEVGAPPVIERVRFTDPASADTSLTQTTLGSVLVIVGQHLSSTQYVLMNDYRVSINSAYATDQHLIVNVPDSVPTVAQNPNVPNTITVVNAFGQASYDFQILPPAPIIEQVSSQYVKEGQTITIFGRYFYFIESIIFPGGVEATDYTAASNGGTIRVTVPAGVDPTDGDLVVNTQSGSSAATLATRLYDGEGIVSNFDDKVNFGWGIAPTNITNSTPNGVIQPLDENFAMINTTLPENWGWSNDKVINLVDWGGAQIYPTEPAEEYSPDLPLADFVIKMEVAVSADAALFSGIQLQVWTDNATEEVSVNIELGDFIRTTDGTWYTVTIPLQDLRGRTSGNPLANYGALIAGNAGGQHQLRVVIENPTPTPVPVVMTIDNIRVENTKIR
ncbi:hypothetical protein SAMN05421823_102346 [Catalinimonas alkaloidigena]|uniref:Surface glycan-binding protein B xyloglucan binding domain-containing protein n=2 Tax=Catalinimonas alkaloidigena TaxID=1075417 RepID=A0A1G9ANA4_9BACT|nr:hypothetical protein SAMN05421823_102346 [Catalinimonas alkaloidigena]